MKKTYDTGKRDTLFANVALGVGAAGIVTGALLFIFSGGSQPDNTLTQPDQPGLSFSPQPPPQGGWAGVRMDGRF